MQRNARAPPGTHACAVTRPPLRPLAALVLIPTLALVALGGVVHTTGSSLACPDWPLCHGQVMPAMEGGVLYEHSHRLLALVVLVGVLALPWAAARGKGRRLAVIGAAVVVAQALLGATTVLLRLPPLVSILHLGGATTLVAILSTLATRGGERRSGPRPAIDLALAAVVTQVLLGAAVRHLGASGACGRDMLACDGELAPEHPLGWLHLAHRAFAVVAAVLVVIAALPALRSGVGATRALGGVLVLAVGIQIALGLASVALGPRLSVVTLHLLFGELIVATLAHLACVPGLTLRSRAPLRPPLAAPSP